VAGERGREEKAVIPRLSVAGLGHGWLVALNAMVLVAACAYSTWARGLFYMDRPLAGCWFAHGGRRGPRSPACVAGGCLWWVGGAALTPWWVSLLCGHRECGLRPRAPPPALVSGLGCDLELRLQADTSHRFVSIADAWGSELSAWLKSSIRVCSSDQFASS
jgi:hypothetical protein